MLYRIWDETVQLHEDDRGFKYISVPIGQMSEVGYQFDIEEIQSDVTLNIPCQCDVVPRTRENI
ncbi:MAG: hypothetical protein J6583_10885 [Gilliamella sp.]|uniref:hypothetical protein n=1 Tax=Gilliamella sp. TaxID=1891236 RepID=UPI0025FA7F0F|nr:hypothetical protein [Gilliamella sp.]MCO6545512.1 hypothetical protein [Gilliamella sp.]MCO6548266.1 hypothetical protein [Gilliamella sp.]